MPITVSYDITNASPQHRNYIRSAFERFCWVRLGGSVFRYRGVPNAQNNENLEEDWLNHVIPAIMFFRSYLLCHQIRLIRFSLDAGSVTHIDHSDPDALFGNAPQRGNELNFAQPSNNQSALSTIQNFIDGAVNIISPFPPSGLPPFPPAPSDLPPFPPAPPDLPPFPPAPTLLRTENE